MPILSAAEILKLQPPPGFSAAWVNLNKLPEREANGWLATKYQTKDSTGGRNYNVLILKPDPPGTALPPDWSPTA